VAFSGTDSTDADGTLVSYAWNFGDGQQATGATVSHTYTQAGTFTATLTVKENHGATSTASVNVQVTSTTLEAPSNFYTQRSGTDVTMRWTDNSRTEEGFILERGPAVAPIQFKEIARVGANIKTFVDKQVAPGKYYYRARTFAGATVSTPSNMDGETIP